MSEGTRAPQRPLVAVVTGASRGVGRGIAVALGSYGCTVYVTGRSQQAGDSPLPGTIHETAEAVTKAGGHGIAVAVDHFRDTDIEALFGRVWREQRRLDILVNNACALPDELIHAGRFWEKPLELADMFDVGLRSSYVATFYAAPLMAERKSGLVIFSSSPSSAHYVFGPAYGAVKAGMDKLAADMAVDFREFGIAALSIWMGATNTEPMQMLIQADRQKYGYLEPDLDTPEFNGHIIWALFNDPELLKLSGHTLISAEIAQKYGIKDAGERQPPSYRDTLGVAPHQQFSTIFR